MTTPPRPGHAVPPASPFPDVTLATGPLLAAATLPCVVIAAAWAGVAALTGLAPLAGVAGAGLVAVVSVATILALTPWRPRSLAVWPLLWTAAGFVRLLAALAGGLLLYSRPLSAGPQMIGPAVLAYAAVMLLETQAYARSMGRYDPTRDGTADVDGPTDDTLTTHSEE